VKIHVLKNVSRLFLDVDDRPSERLEITSSEERYECAVYSKLNKSVQYFIFYSRFPH